MDEDTRKRRLEKIIELFKSWAGPVPDYDNLDFSRYHQTEAEYQHEQRQWLENLRREKELRKASGSEEQIPGGKGSP